MGAGCHADFDRDVADLVLPTTVRALLLHRYALANYRLLEHLESELNRGAVLFGRAQLLLGGTLGCHRRILREDFRLHFLGGLLAVAPGRPTRGSARAAARRPRSVRTLSSSCRPSRRARAAVRIAS